MTMVIKSAPWAIPNIIPPTRFVNDRIELLKSGRSNKLIKPLNRRVIRNKETNATAIFAVGSLIVDLRINEKSLLKKILTKKAIIQLNNA